jgi:peptidoglycan DL-endopeptidase CwlO
MRLLAKLCLVAAVCCAVVATPTRGGAQTVASLRSQLDEAGERLERASDAYNLAKIRRSRLDDKLAAARTDVARSEERLAAERAKLGHAVRNLYMHPAAGLGTFFQAKSYGELQRGNALSTKAALSADTLILRVRKARAEQKSSVDTLRNLRDQARNYELAMLKERETAEASQLKTKQLLAAANGALARELEAERLAGLREAPSIAKSTIHFAGKVSPGAATAVATAAAQLGKPYVWGAAGPSSYDCSGLTMYSWGKAGVQMDHYTGSQYSAFPKVPISELRPGDLVFFYSDLHHVGIYEGDGIMIHAPHTGDVVKRSSIYRMGGSPVGAVRPG